MNEMQQTNKDELVSLLYELVKSQKKSYKTLVRVFIITVILYTFVLISMICGFVWYESQFDYTETLAYTEETTQEVDGDNATINNVEGNQYNDSAIHNEGD